MIGQRLEKFFPRPTLLEAQKLFAYLNPNMAEQNAYEYFLRRMLNDGDDSGYLATATQYLRDVNPFDHEVLHGVVRMRIALNDITNQQHNADMMIQAMALDDLNPEYRYTTALVYFKKKDKQAALNYIDQAISLLPAGDSAQLEYVALRDRISSEL